VSRSTSLLPTLPPQAGATALAWLKQQPCVTLRMGVGAKSVRPNGVTLDDGSELSADLVYHCGGATSSPNAILKKHFGDCLDPKSGRLLVNDHLQVLKTVEHLQQDGVVGSTASKISTEVPDRTDSEPAIFAAGDCIVHSASNELQLGHTAELNAHVVADNILRLARYRERHRKQRCTSGSVQGNAASEHDGPELLTYPQGAHGLRRSPQVFCVSLGPHFAVLSFNGLVLSGCLPAFMKWLIEWTKVMLFCA